MTHPGKLALDAMVETAGKALVPMTHRCPAQDDCAACNVTYDHYAAADPSAVQSVAAYVAELLKLITDIDASDSLEHSIRCTIHAHGDMANAVCSCGLNELQERINKELTE